MSKLTLDGDRESTAPTIADLLQVWVSDEPLRGAVARVVNAVAEAASPIALRLGRPSCPAILRE